MTEIDDLVEEATDAGVDPDQLAEVLDGLIDFRLALPGPAGVVLEVVDGPAIKAALKAIGRAVRKLTSPEARAAAKERRAKRRAARAARRDNV